MTSTPCDVIYMIGITAVGVGPRLYSFLGSFARKLILNQGLNPDVLLLIEATIFVEVTIFVTESSNNKNCYFDKY